MPSDLFTPITSSPYFQLGTKLGLIFGIVFWLALAFWMWRDADRRGAMPWFWAIAGLVFPVAGWAIYMVVRPPESLEDVQERELEIRAREAEIQRTGTVCPNCFKPVEPDYLICPNCMKKLKKPCVNCGRPIKMSWAVCPYCKSKQAAADPPVEPMDPKKSRGRGAEAASEA
jgi:RNA polymerase subunit RPABC4/transcription elongation factor Spt4